MKMKLLFLLIIAASLIEFACKKNDGGPPTISDVRAVDPTKKDSLFKEAVPGTLIVIQGANLNGATAVFFNDTSAYFNPVYNTSSNLIVTIPATAQTAATNPSVKNQIKVVTNHGTATYSFTLYLPPPTISSISFDNTGTIVYITGTNLQGVQKITFPIPSGPDTALSYNVNKTATQITAEIPPGTAFQDSLRVYCTFGEASYPYPPPMTITSVSNENGTAGTTITLNGTNFVGVTQVMFPGNIPGTNIVTNSVSQISVTVPAGITSIDTLRVTGALGTASSPQPFDTYLSSPSPGYLCNFENQWNTDNTGFVGWTGGYADAPTTTANYPGGTGASGFILQGSPMGNNSGVGSQGNPGFIQLNDVPWVSNTGTAVAGYSLKFEIYVKNPWTAGALWIMMGDWYGWHNYLARYAPWSTDPSGKFAPSGWVTVTIPLTQLLTITGGSNSDNNTWDLGSYPTGGVPASKFSDYSSTALCFALNNDQANGAIPANTLNIAIDNVRIVQGQ